MLKSILLFTNPRETRDNGQPDCLLVKAQRHSYTHPAIRRIDPEMEILDVLPDHLHL